MNYFLSDAHLGSRVIADPQAHQARLTGLLETMAEDASRIYLLGDMFDFWCEYIWHRNETLEHYARRTGDKGFAPFLYTLKALVEKGVEVYYFIGNHDIWTFGWLARVTGVTIHRQPLETDLCGWHLYLAHGDGLVPSDYVKSLSKTAQRRIRRFRVLRAMFHHPVLQFLLRLLPPCAGDAMGYDWARRSRQKELDNPCPYKGEQKEDLVLFAKEKERQKNVSESPLPTLYVFGHRHIELDLQISRTARVAILGDCFRQWTYATLSDDGIFLLCNLEE